MRNNSSDQFYSVTNLLATASEPKANIGHDFMCCGGAFIWVPTIPVVPSGKSAYDTGHGISEIMLVQHRSERTIFGFIRVQLHCRSIFPTYRKPITLRRLPGEEELYASLKTGN